MDIKIVIALHKPYEVPEDRLYLPLQVGAAGKKGIKVEDCKGAKVTPAAMETAAIMRDDDGENISAKNPYYCELTALYWAWKNLDADAIGLVHYRRHFSNKSKSFIKKNGAFNSVLTADEVQAFLTKADIVVPKKRKYYIESLYSHYAHTHDATHLDLAREIIKEKYPDFLPYVDRAYAQTWGYMFNMAILPKRELDDYCSWIFDILFSLEEKIEGVEKLSAFSARLYGRVSEILFTAWVLKKQSDGLSAVECPVIDMEPVNWPRKIWGFLTAKFAGKKYTKSM